MQKMQQSMTEGRWQDRPDFSVILETLQGMRPVEGTVVVHTERAQVQDPPAIDPVAVQMVQMGPQIDMVRRV